MAPGLPGRIRALDAQLRARRDTARFYIITITMIAAMIATITMIITGLLLMCRSMPNFVPSGSNSMRHLGHVPGFG